MAEGLREGDGGRHLMTFHPRGARTSAADLHDESWLDFNMWQTGHTRHSPTYDLIASDYARQPAKPCMDGEPLYENIPNAFDARTGFIDEHAVRISAYWGLFAGGHGFTYGCNEIWQFWQPGREPTIGAHLPWQRALHLPAAWQMRHLRALLTSRPFFDRIPDQSLIAGSNHSGIDHAQACRSNRGAYAMIYLPTGLPVTVIGGKLAGDRLRAWWYNPRDGAAILHGEIDRSDEMTFTPPASGYGHDWVLVLDDPLASFPPPGACGK
jgi:hypothetical protein